MKKAQIQAGETIFITFIIIILLVLGLVIYSKIQESEFKDKAREQRNYDLILTAQTLARMPEFGCSVYSSRDFACIDQVKLGVSQSFMNGSDSKSTYQFRYYNELFKKSKITVWQTYPSSQQWVVYNNSGLGRSTNTIFIPITVYDPLLGRNNFGIVELSVYE